jgi:hypothetical protein
MDVCHAERGSGPVAFEDSESFKIQKGHVRMRQLAQCGPLKDPPS